MPANIIDLRHEDNQGDGVDGVQSSGLDPLQPPLRDNSRQHLFVDIAGVTYSTGSYIMLGGLYQGSGEQRTSQFAGRAMSW